MSNLYLPGVTDLALALREPSLLVPGRKPVGRIRLRQKWAGRVVRCFLCDSAVELVSGKSAAPNGTVYISTDIGGLSWATDGSATSYFDSGTNATHALNGSFLHCDVVVFRDTSGSKGYLFGTVATSGSTIDDLAINTSWTEGEVSGYVMKFIRGHTSGQNIRAASPITCNNGEVRAVAFAKIGDSEFAISTDGHPTVLYYGLQTAVTSIQDQVPGANYWYGTRNLRNSPSIGLSSQSRLYLHARIIGNTTEAERNALSANPWGELFEPANQTSFLIGLPGGTPIHTGSGTLTGAGTVIAGIGERTVVGTGVLEGQGAAIAGTGDTAGAVAGDGALVGHGSQIVGTGVRTAVGSGALVADGSDITGVAERIVTGAGVLAGQGSVVSGTGLVEGTVTGTGTLVGAGSAIVGTGERTVKGTGDLAAQGSAVVGVGERVVAGSGALVGAGSVVAGTGETGDETVGSGVLVGQGAAVVGTGERIITGVADLIGQGSIIVGTAVRTVIGSGALVGAGSEVVGVYIEEDCTDPPTYTLFDDARKRLHDAVLRQFGEEVMFSALGLTVTAHYRRKQDDVPGGGARPGVPRDELRIKQTDICAYDIDQGEQVTVRGYAYKVISVERTKHGLTTLGIRRTH